mgnify:CR=1 FL=1
MELRELYEPSLMRGRDFKINDKITIHMPSVGDIIDYGEQKYFQLVYLFCSTSSDYKAQLDSVGVDWQKVSDFEMFRQLFIGNKNQDMSILLGDMDTSGFMMAKDNISGEIVLHNGNLKTDISKSLVPNPNDLITLCMLCKVKTTCGGKYPNWDHYI